MYEVAVRALIGGLIVYFWLREYWRFFLGYRSEKWPKVRGQVLKSHIESSMDDGREWFMPRVKYSYRVGAKQFTSKTLSYHPLPVASYDIVSHDLSGVTRGHEVDVYFDPAVPGRSVLIPGLRIDNYLLSIVLTASMVLMCVKGL
jgi:Protein of unknown function (DUF3592)